MSRIDRIRPRRTTMSRKAKGVAVAVALIASVAGPISVAPAGGERVVRFGFTEGPFTNVFAPCGATESVTVTVRGADVFDAGGTFIRSRAHFSYDSVVTGPTGTSIALDAHQNQKVTAAGVLTLTGQGANVRAPGMGLLYQDVGRLVVDVSGPFPGQTMFASAKAVSFEAFDPDALAAAICAAVA
jgi:hypothetical protein